MTLTFVLVCSLALTQSAPQKQRPLPPRPAQPSPAAAATSPERSVSDTLRIQVMLDRAGFSPGAIDGRTGPSTRKALEAYRKQTGNATQEPFEPLIRYRITAQDAAGPFVENIPTDLVEQAKLPHLGYRSIVEALAERFHTTPALLQQLNPSVRLEEGNEILVPNVEPLTLATAEQSQQAARGRGRGREGAVGTTGMTAPPAVVVTVSKTTSALTVTDDSGRILMYAPVTTGSEMDPLPIGEWKVNGVSLNPPFNYNPKLFWDANPEHLKAKIPPGPNNPVGLVWIDLSKEHYGIHGSPEPTQIGKSQSHGCVRMTNWDAVKLASFVKPGTRVVFTE